MSKKPESEETGMIDTEKLKEIYGLTPHEEGGSFSEVYTAPFEAGGRPMAGSIDIGDGCAVTVPSVTHTTSDERKKSKEQKHS